MKTAEIEVVLKEALRQIAPDMDIMTIDLDADLREELDIDSMDFLNLVTALSEQLQVTMPEIDYPYIMTYNAMVTYLDKHTT